MSEISTNPLEQRSLVEEILANRPTDSRARRKIAILDGRLKPDEIIDPNCPPKPSAGERAVDVDRFTCPQCGGRMVFAPDGQSLTCEYCESRHNLQRFAPVDVTEQDFVAALATTRGHLAPNAVQTFACQGCGASFLLPPNQLSLTCPYCEAAYVVRQKNPCEFVTPGGIVPFRVDEKQARQALSDWLVANLAGKDVRVARGVALYLPAWTFDIGGELTWRGTRPSNRRQQAPQPVNGSRPVLINDLLIPAVSRLSKTCLAELLHFDLAAMLPYDERFLSNWPAETYQLSAADASLEARRLALQREEIKLKETLAEPLRDLVVLPGRLAVESFRLVLLPLWLTHYRYEDRRYEVVINGLSGAVRAEKPANGVMRWLGLA